MMKNLDEVPCYKVTFNTTDMVKNRIWNLSKEWKIARYFGSNCSIKDTNLPRAHGLIKLHKENQPARIIVPCIDSAVEELSNFYKNILTAACPRLKQIIKNSDFEEIHVSKYFNRTGEKSIKNRWNKIQEHTKCHNQNL